MSEGERRAERRVQHRPLIATLVSLACFVRGIPLLFRTAPGTPLRVLCIVALDTVHRLRHSQAIPRQRISELADFLDFQACTNATWDRKHLCAAEYQAIRHRLEEAGLGSSMAQYVVAIRQLERGRPSPGGGPCRFDAVRAYREAVARTSLAAVAAIALNTKCLNDALRAIQRDDDLDTLYRIVMQCQVIDDVLDYAEDASLGLPSFVTACASLTHALRMTSRAARSYAAISECSSRSGVFPLRVALHVITALTKFVIGIARAEYRMLRRACTPGGRARPCAARRTAA
jgi:hypothetical protein